MEVHLVRSQDGEFTLLVKDELSRNQVLAVSMTPAAIADLISSRMAKGRATLHNNTFFGQRQVQNRSTRVLNIPAASPEGRLKDAIEELRGQTPSGVYLRTLESSQGGLTPHPTKKNKSVLQVIEIRYVDP